MKRKRHWTWFKKGHVPWIKGKKLDPLQYPKYFNKQPHTAASKLKNRLAHLGKKHTLATRQKMSRSRRHRVGPLAPGWKGGRARNGRYFLLLKPDHPCANGRGYILEHRFIMEQHLGRHLFPDEVVHHLNNNPSDNRLENLKLLRDDSEHGKMHYHKGASVIIQNRARRR